MLLIFLTPVLIRHLWKLKTIWLYHPLDGIINLEYNLLCFLTPNKIIFKEKGASF